MKNKRGDNINEGVLGKISGRFAGKAASAAGRLVSNDVVQSLGINFGTGIAIEGGARAIESRRRAKERAAKLAARSHRAGIATNNRMNESLSTEPPVVLILKRKSIRLYPQGERIAIYRNDKLGLKFAVPYDTTRKKDDDNNTNMEPKKDDFRGMSFSEGWFKDNFGTADPKKLRKTLNKLDALGHPGIKNPWVAVGATIAGAATAGYATDKAIKYVRRKIERPNNKKVDGSYVYSESVSPDGGIFHRPRIDPKMSKKLGLKLGVLTATGVISYDAIQRLSNKKKKKKSINEMPLVPGGTSARRPKGRSSKMKTVWTKTPRGYKRARVLSALGGPQNVKAWIANATAGALVGGVVGSVASYAASDKYRSKEKKKKKLDEIAPLLAGIAARLAVGSAIRSGAKAVGKEVATSAAIQTGVSGGSKAIGALRARKKPLVVNDDDSVATGSDDVNENATAALAYKTAMKTASRRGIGKKLVVGTANAAKSAATFLAQIALIGGATSLASVAVDKVMPPSEDIDPELVGENALATIKQKGEKIKKRWIPQDYRKEIVKGGAIALGSAVATKAMDLGYDAWKENNKKAIKEVKHSNGSASFITEEDSQQINELYSVLTPENQERLLAMVAKDEQGLSKVLQFAKRNG